jgi:RHS repeat-associated protein
MSRRVLKITPDATHTFVYDGWNLVQETINNQQLTITNHFVWGKDLSGTMQGAGGVGGLLAVKQANAWYFPFYDANGNITAYVDESGSVVAEYTYDAFGATISQSGSMASAFRFRFSTKYYDSETCQYYYGMRFYSPDLHRWLNRDPIEEDGGLNLYSFCGNDGMNRWDVLGMEWHVKRDGKPYAIAFSDNDGDTFDGLGIIVGLDTEDYPEWAHTTDASPVRCKEYQIPNVVVYHIGRSKYPWPLSYCDSLLLDSQRAEFQRSALGDESAGFYVMLQTDVSDAEIRFSLGWRVIVSLLLFRTWV